MHALSRSLAELAALNPYDANESKKRYNGIFVFV